MANILALLKEKDQITIGLNSLHHGSIEIRPVEGKRYIYVHSREEDSPKTKYVGEYSEELVASIKKDNEISTSLKRRKKEIDKQLKAMGYNLSPLGERCGLCTSLASRYLAEYIYNQAALEGLPTSYEDTEELIYEGGVKGLNLREIQVILSLKEAWKLILSDGGLSCPTSFDMLSTINAIVEQYGAGAPGSVRTVPVKIHGCSYLPPLPIESEIKDKINGIIDEGPSLNTGVSLLLYVMKTQIFRDGNKRSAVIFANHYFVREGLGLISIPKEKLHQFSSLLIRYYDTGEEKEIREFLLGECTLDIATLLDEANKQRKIEEDKFRKK